MAKMLIMVFQVIVLWDVNISEDVLITADMKFMHLFAMHCELITGYCYGLVFCKASHALQPFSNLLCVPI
jgi:hypothetical protein